MANVLRTYSNMKSSCMHSESWYWSIDHELVLVLPSSDNEMPTAQSRQTCGKPKLKSWTCTTQIESMIPQAADLLQKSNADCWCVCVCVTATAILRLGVSDSQPLKLLPDGMWPQKLNARSPEADLVMVYLNLAISSSGFWDHATTMAMHSNCARHRHRRAEPRAKASEPLPSAIHGPL